MLKEEVKFSATNVTSLDWASYPVLRFGEAPEVTAISVMRQDQTSSGAGEESLAAGSGRDRKRILRCDRECDCTDFR